MQVTLTEDEAEMVVLTLEYFRRYHMVEYAEEYRKEALDTVISVERKLRLAE